MSSLPIYKKSILKSWKNLVGESREFSLENRIFNALSIIIIVGLGLLIPFNVYIGLPLISLFLGGTFVVQGCLYYLSRIKKKFILAGIIYCFFEYLFLIVNYYFNSGINGPTILGFIVSFIVFIIITPPRWHPLWIALYILLMSGLLALEYFNMGIHYSYSSLHDRFTDTAGTYIVLLVCLYFIIIYIRNNYNAEKKLAEQRATAIAEQNQQLEVLNNDKSRLFSIISHDLRTPLNSIQGYLEVLADSPLSESEKTKIKADLLMLTKHTQDMLFNLLSWSKSQLSGNAVEMKPFNLYSSLSGTLNMLQAVAVKKGITLKNAIDPAIQINADADMTQLVIRNLVHNAIKFTSNGGEILITTTAKGNECTVSIKDNGQGIPVEKQPDIFSLKIRSAWGTKKEKGIGLGLFLCRQLIELQFGRIWFTSQPGNGSEFMLALPVANTSLF